MACEIVSTERAVFVLWGKPTRADLDRVIDRVKLVAEKSTQKIVYITRVPTDAPPPDSDVRQHLNSLMPQFVEACSSYHVVLEGGGFLSALKRGILASLLQFGWRNGTFFVHENERGIVYKVDRAAKDDVEAILRIADTTGLLSAAPPKDAAPLPVAARARTL
jgi:hypothetical protein